MVRSQVLKTYLQRAPSSLRVVSFDVFDTLLIRMVPSERVVQIAVENLCNLLGQPALVPVVARSRRAFSKNSERASTNNGAAWAVSQWLEELSRTQGFDFQQLLQLGRKSELNAEIESLRLADEAVEALSIVREHGLQTIAISDMWLEQEWLRELLERFGLVFNEVFSSATIKHSKDKGTIFKAVEHHMNCLSKEFLHVGDNLKADLLQPRLNGWKAIWMPKAYEPLLKQVVPEKVKKVSLRQTGCQEILQAIHIPRVAESSPYFKLAYDYLAPLLLIFSLVQWRRFLEQNIEVAFYIARDARVMMDVYDTISDLLPGSCPRRYIRLSRRAVALAHPDDLCQNVIPLAGKIGKKTISEWLSNFTLGDGLHQRILSETELLASMPLTQMSKNTLRKACRTHLTEIEIAQRNLRAKVHDYLLQQVGTKGVRRIGIVDSGWACTTQDTIRGVFAEAELISGVYLGVGRQGHEPIAENRKYGLLRDDFRCRRYHNPLEASAGVIRMWDSLLREPVGSVRRLERHADGRVEPVLDDHKAIGKLEHEAANTIRSGILTGTRARRKGFALLVKLTDQFCDRDFEMAATAIASNISTHPTRQIADAILQLGFDEGIAEGRVGSLGCSGIKHGVAWYPGILAYLGFGWLAPTLKYPAKVLRWQKNRCQ